MIPITLSTAINGFISKIVVHERDVKKAKYAVQRIEVYFNYIGKFENELTKDIEPTEEEMIQMREKIEELRKKNNEPIIEHIPKNTEPKILKNSESTNG